jgi:dihydrofolate synthase/folylpolyglutamate synthase
MYISPFVEEFRERIQVNREMISEEELAIRMTRIKEVIDGMIEEGLNSPTEFEIITALALDYFAAMNCDVAVLEVGLGGRLDATNVIERPEVSIICPISFDHMQYLGDTIAKIAFEKCGIIKKGCPVVSAYGQFSDALEVIQGVSGERDSELHLPNPSKLTGVFSDVSGCSYRYDGLDIRVNMGGRHQIQNSLTAITAARVLARNGWKITGKDIEDGIAATRFGGRLEIVTTSPLTIIDGAHNPDGINKLCGYIDNMLHGKRLVVVMGMLSDKDCATCFPKIARRASFLVATKPDSPRALPPEKAAELIKGICPCAAEENVTKAVEIELKHLRPDDVLIACGSLYMIGEAKAALLKKLSS